MNVKISYFFLVYFFLWVGKCFGDIMYILSRTRVEYGARAGYRLKSDKITMYIKCMYNIYMYVCVCCIFIVNRFFYMWKSRKYTPIPTYYDIYLYIWLRDRRITKPTTCSILSEKQKYNEKRWLLPFIVYPLVHTVLHICWAPCVRGISRPRGGGLHNNNPTPAKAAAITALRLLLRGWKCLRACNWI